MDKNDIIDYVMNTPGNTNRAVLSSMLNQFGGGGADSGVMIIHENWALDKTMGEIWEAVQRGIILVLVDSQGNYYQGAKVCVNDDGSSYYGAVTFNGGQMWEAHSADAYPEPNV